MAQHTRHRQARTNARIQVRKSVKHINGQHKDTHNDACNDRYARIHIQIKYDNYNATAYIPVIYGKTRDTHAQRYVGMHNAIREIFPSIEQPHTQHIHRATAEYHRYIAQKTDYTRPQLSADETSDHADYQPHTKCIIFDAHDKLIHYGIFGRTRTINYITRETHTTLHRANRSFEVYPYIPRTDTILGVSVAHIKAQGVEIYQI